MEKREAPKEHVNKKESRKEAVLLYLHDFVSWLVVILLVFLLLFRVVVVSGPSMNSTLLHWIC